MPNVIYKMPRTRTESNFTVYPFNEGTTKFRLQSEHYCIIADMENNVIYSSKRFGSYPRFEACYLRNGGTCTTMPETIKEQLTTIMKYPTGMIVSLT